MFDQKIKINVDDVAVDVDGTTELGTRNTESRNLVWVLSSQFQDSEFREPVHASCMSYVMYDV